MANSLVIVESPAKAKTLHKYLGKDFVVEASVGHIKNLPQKDIAVDIENGYTPRYVTIRGKAKVVKNLKSKAAKASTIYIATDPDREGEAIAAHIAEELKKESQGKEVFRILFNEITKTGVKEGMSNPRHIDGNLVASQQARRVMDRLVGYKVSPFLWKAIYYGLSAGRVQSVALRFICEREEEIRAFVQREYWSITGEFETEKKETFHAKLVGIEGVEPEIPNEATAQHLVERIRGHSYRLTDVSTKEVKRQPTAPFITSSLQQEASTRLRFGTKRTMALAQQLYEGVELGAEGAVGLITYMRTDSTRVSDEALTALRQFIEKTYGKEFVHEEERVFKKRQNTQDAHEAIRPTSMENTPQHVRPFLSKEQYALYELIWKRFVASQMAPARLNQTTLLVNGGPFQFKGVGSIYTFRGYLQVYDDFEVENGEEHEEESIIPDTLAANQNVAPYQIDPHQHFTKPPARYTEASLVKELDAKGIGRPSTYAMIVSTIIDRGYVDAKERKLYATELGLGVNKLLRENFKNIFDIDFTSRMEDELDTIASGEATYIQVMDDFYKPFSENLAQVHAENIFLKEDTEHACDKCGKPMIIRWGRNGRFLACSGYPECKNAKPLPEDAEKMKIDEKCPECGNPLTIKQSRYGKFIGCSNYPECKYLRPISLKIKCPKCETGEVCERQSKTKRTFYGCIRYPNCDFVSWDRPVDKACPSCGNAYLSHKYNQKKGEYLKCPTCKLEFTKELEPLDEINIAA